MNDKFEVYQDKRGEWRWRRKSANGRIVGASAEGYHSKDDALANLNRGPNKDDRWEFYQDKRGTWRWRRSTRMGRIIGASSEGFERLSDAESNAARLGYSG